MDEPPVRKMARHDIAEVRDFLQRADRDRLGVYHVDEETQDLRESDFRKIFPQVEPAADAPRPTAIQDGALFYAATVGENHKKEVFLTVYLRTDTEMPASTEAVICHVAYDLVKLNAHRNVLGRLFSAVERFAASQAKDSLRVCVRHTSFLIYHHLSLTPYQVDSYAINAARLLLITFKRPLVRDFRGDILDWEELTKWYLRFSFPRLKRDDFKPRYLNDGVLEYELSLGQTFDSDEAVRDCQCPVLMRVVTIAADAGDCAGVTPADGRFHLVLLEQPTGRLRAQCGKHAVVKSRDDLEDAVATVKRFYLRGSDFDPSVNRSEVDWNKWWNLKAGNDRKRRCGIIVEIDRHSYIDLLEKLKEAPSRSASSRDDSFIFLNYGGFAEQIAVGTTVFFFAWDAKHQESGDSGVLCASATLVASDKYTLNSLGENWRRIRTKTIYKDAEFPRQYFKGDVVALTIKDLRGEFLADRDLSTAVPYHDLIRLLGGTVSEIKPASPRAPILPVWGIGNTYLTNNQVEALENAMHQAIEPERWFGRDVRPNRQPHTELPPAPGGVRTYIFHGPVGSVNPDSLGTINNSVVQAAPSGFADKLREFTDKPSSEEKPS